MVRILEESNSWERIMRINNKQLNQVSYYVYLTQEPCKPCNLQSFYSASWHVLWFYTELIIMYFSYVLKIIILVHSIQILIIKYYIIMHAMISCSDFERTIM